MVVRKKWCGTKKKIGEAEKNKIIFSWLQAMWLQTPWIVRRCLAWLWEQEAEEDGVKKNR